MMLSEQKMFVFCLKQIEFVISNVTLIQRLMDINLF